MTVIAGGKFSHRKLFSIRKMAITYKKNVNGSILILTYAFKHHCENLLKRTLLFFLVVLREEGKKITTGENSKFISCQSLVTVADQILQ